MRASTVTSSTFFSPFLQLFQQLTLETTNPCPYVIHSFIHSFILSFVHSFIRSFIHSFVKRVPKCQLNGHFRSKHTLNFGPKPRAVNIRLIGIPRESGSLRNPAKNRWERKFIAQCTCLFVLLSNPDTFQGNGDVCG